MNTNPETEGPLAHAAGLDFGTFNDWSAAGANYKAPEAGAAWRSFKAGKGMVPAEVWARWRDGDRTAPIPIRPATQPTEHSVLPVGDGLHIGGVSMAGALLVPADAPEKKTGKRMGEVEGAVIEFLAAHKIGIKKAALAKHFDGRYERTNVYRSIKTLLTAQAIHEAAGMVCIAGAAK